jgi:hypothetical protein
MARFPILSWLKAAARPETRSPRKCPPALRRRPARHVPQLEALEARLTPSTDPVTSAADDGSSGTLRAVIAAANPGDTIVFDSSLVGKTIALKLGQLNVTKSLDIAGPGADSLTVSAGGVSRVFDVRGAIVTIAGLTVADGTAGSAALGDGGGGIINEPGATLYLVNDVVANNTAQSIGGGLWNRIGATVSISNTTFAGNQAIGSLNFNYPDEGFVPGNATAEGGAIDNDGTATVTGSTFTRNLAVGTAGGTGSSGHGGAIGSDGPLTVASSTFSRNQALGAPVASGFTTTTLASDGIGGAIVAFDTTSISNSTFTSNEAAGGDGGVGFVYPVTSFRGIGGAVAMEFLTAVVSGSTFDHNQAVGGAGGAGSPGSLGIGGGLDAILCTLTVRQTVFSHNAAVGGAGANAARWDGAGIGGGLSVERSSTVTLTGLTVTDNDARGGAGYAGSNGGTGYGGGLSIGSRWIWARQDGTVATLADSTVADNRALGGDGGQGSNGGSGFGGGVFLGGTLGGLTPKLTITTSTITGNHANGGSAGAGGSDGLGEGGGIYDLGTLVLDAASVVRKNHASTSNDDIF